MAHLDVDIRHRHAVACIDPMRERRFHMRRVQRAAAQARKGRQMPGAVHVRQVPGTARVWQVPAPKRRAAQEPAMWYCRGSSSRGVFTLERDTSTFEKGREGSLAGRNAPAGTKWRACLPQRRGWIRLCCTVTVATYRHIPAKIPQRADARRPTATTLLAYSRSSSLLAHISCVCARAGVSACVFLFVVDLRASV